MRLFIAFELSDKSKDKIFNLYSGNFGKISDIKWIVRDNLHITVVFLGETAEDKIGQIIKIIEDKLIINKRINIVFDKIGIFMHGKLSVFYLGTREKNLEQQVSVLKKEFSKKGIGRDVGKYTAHLTLCRVKNSLNANSDFFSKLLGNFNLNIRVTGIALYESLLGSEGSRYRMIRFFEF